MTEGRVVVGAKTFGRGIPDDFHWKRKLAVAHCRRLGYVEGEDYAYAGTAVDGKIRQQRRNHGAMAVADNRDRHPVGFFRWREGFLNQTGFRNSISKTIDRRSEKLIGTIQLRIRFHSADVKPVCHKGQTASKSPPPGFFAKVSR